MSAFGDRAFKEVMKSKQGRCRGPWAPPTGVLNKKGNQDTDTHGRPAARGRRETRLWRTSPTHAFISDPSLQTGRKNVCCLDAWLGCFVAALPNDPALQLGVLQKDGEEKGCPLSVTPALGGTPVPFAECVCSGGAVEVQSGPSTQTRWTPPSGSSPRCSERRAFSVSYKT